MGRGGVGAEKQSKQEDGENPSEAGKAGGTIAFCCKQQRFIFA